MKDLFQILLYQSPPRPSIYKDPPLTPEQEADYWGDLQSDYWIDLHKSEQQYD